MRHASIPGALSCGTRRLCKNAAALVAGIVATGLLLVVSPAQAVSVPYVPSGLNPGDTYHVVFVTDQKRDATSSNIADYNAFVQSQAELAGALTQNWGVSWSAIASTATVDARDNIAVDTSPIYLLPFQGSGDLVADNATDLWDGSIQAFIQTDQFGTIEGQDNIWTGTATDGTESLFLTLPAGLGSSNPRTGSSGDAEAGWVDFATEPADTSLALYAVSEELTVVPVPAAVWLFGSGLLGLVGVARRSKA
jgi:hypothetical protein